jgi:hypothetical protein
LGEHGLRPKPPILEGDSFTQKIKGFRFESYWLKIPRFQDVVKQAWSKPLQATDVIRRLHIKLSHMAKVLKSWKNLTLGILKCSSPSIKKCCGNLTKPKKEGA